MNLYTFYYLLVLVVVCHGLSEDEERAISALFQEWPVLSSVHPPWSANASSACSTNGFHGISCSQPPESHVLSLILEDIPLAGSMPSEITDLLWLEVLIFQNASLVGSIPDDLGKLRNLTSFVIEQMESTSFMSGSIPESVSYLGELEELVLRANGLSGNLPSHIGGHVPNFERSKWSIEVDHEEIEEVLWREGRSDRTFPEFDQFASDEPIPDIGCHKLKKLVLNSPRTFADDPAFGGEMTFSLCLLHELTHLDLSNTYFYQVRCNGRWPKLEVLRLAFMPLNSFLTFDFLTQARPLLQVLDLEATKMRGGLHVNATLTPHLAYLNFENCFLSGQVSEDLWLLQNLTYINLQYNTLAGSISSNIGSLSQLQHVDLSFTSLSGSIPSSLGDCISLDFLNLGNTQLSGEIPDTLANASNLKFLDLSFSNLESTIPASIGRLKSLKYMLIESAGLYGTMPDEMTQMTNLVNLNLRLNRLEGSIPSFGQSFEVLDLSGNLLEGEIPSIVLANGNRIDLSKNRLSGSIPSSIGFNDNLLLIDLSANLLSGSLPIMRQTWNGETGIDEIRDDFASSIPPSDFQMVFEKNQVEMASVGNEKTSSKSRHVKESIVFRLGSNMLSGPFPMSYGNVRFREVSLADNALSGGIVHLFQSGATKTLEVVDLRLNDLDSIISELNAPRLQVLLLGGNKLSGDLSLPFSPLTTLDISLNRFTSSVFSTLDRAKLTSTLEYLDMSANEMEGTIPPFLFAIPTLKSLSLSRNNFTGTIPRPPLTSFGASSGSNFESIDLSFNQLTGSWPYHPSAFLDLRSLKLSHNQLSGGLHLDSSPALESLEISHNNFSFDANQFSSRPFLSYLDAQSNLIYGILSFKGSNALKTADLSRNRLDQQPDLFSISSLFSSYSLFYLSILNNPLIPPFSQIDPEMLNKTSSSSPSILSTGVICYQLAFSASDAVDDADLTFLYDEGMFGYLQCECDSTHFGLPPSSCFPCPSHSSPLASSCSANTLHIPSNTFVFKLGSELSPSDPPLVVEPCLQSLILERSNCIGVSISFQFEVFSTQNRKAPSRHSFTSGDVFPAKKRTPKRTEMRGTAEKRVATHMEDLTTSLSINPSTILAAPHMLRNVLNYSMLPSESALISLQCRAGSSGRLCSKCDCDLLNAHSSTFEALNKSDPSRRVCYFPGPGNICTQCKYVFRTIDSVMFGIGLILIAAIILTVIFLLVLRSKRSEKDLEWENLSLGKRLLYRLLYAMSLGYLPILITFLQLGVELTDWNGYAVRLWMNMINAQSSAPLCLFPSLLSSALPRLLLRLFLPFLVVLLVAACVGLAEVIFRKFFSNNFSPHQQWSLKLKLPSYSAISSTEPIIPGDGYSSVYSSSMLQPPQTTIDSEQNVALEELEVQDKASRGMQEEKMQAKNPSQEIPTDTSPLLIKSETPNIERAQAVGDESRRDAQEEKGQYQKYPALALVSSVSISVLRFFYFGTALSAFQYVFSEEQVVTKAKYVQSVPWMKFDDAIALRSVSIPFIVVFLLGLPLLYLLWGWKVRKLLFDVPPSSATDSASLNSQIGSWGDLSLLNSQKRRTVKQYSGSLFQAFKPTFFWWEIVNISKKLSIALVLRMTPEAGIAQPFLMAFLIGFFQLLSSTFRPWKRRLENMLEDVGALLLLLSLLASRLVRTLETSSLSSFSHPLLIFSLILDLLFILVCICMIFYQTIRGETEYQRQWKERFTLSSLINSTSLHSFDDAEHKVIENDQEIM